MYLSDNLSPEAKALIPILKELIEKHVLRVELSDNQHEYYVYKIGDIIEHKLDVHLLVTPNDTRTYNSSIPIHGFSPK